MALFDDILKEEAPPQKSFWEKIKGGAKTFGEALIEAPRALGEDIARLTPEYKATKEAEGRETILKNQLATQIKSLPIGSPRRTTIEKFLVEESPKLSQVLPERNARQIAGDVIETALLAVPFPAVKALKGLPWLVKAVRGVSIGGAFGLTTAIREKEFEPTEALKRTAFGAGLGIGAEFALPFVGKGIVKAPKIIGKGIVRVGEKIIPERVKISVSALKQSLISIKSRLGTYYGEEGKQIINKFLRADEEKLSRTGQVVDKLDDLGFYKISKQESQNLVDMLEGRTKEPISEIVKNNFKYIDNLRKGIGQEATEVGVKIRVRRGVEYPFRPRENYYPHDVLLPETLKNPEIRQEILENVIRTRKFKDIIQAEKVLNSWIEITEKNGQIGRENFFVNHLIDSGQAKTKDEARGMIMRFFKKARLPKFGHLEYAREFDFPFYDPNPQRVITKWIMGSVDRLETIKAFGIKGQELSRLLGAIKRKQGVELGREATYLVKELTGAIERSPGPQKISSFVRALQVPKLAFSQIVNLGQNVNTLLATDLPSFAKGLTSIFTKMGRKQALRAGATLESIIGQTIELGAGGEQKFAKLFLKYSGFQLTEKINRTVAANAGIAYAQRNFQQLLKKPTDKFLKQRLEEVGINVEQAIKRGKLTEPELLKAGQKIAEITQFRYRPADFPAFYNSDFGRMAFQFKSFAYNQTIFLKNQLIKEFTSGKPERAVRTLIILGLIFPMTGEITQDIRSLITQQKRPTNALDRYLNEIMSVGGFGLLSDLYLSATWGRLSETLLGPAIGSVTQAIEAGVKGMQVGKLTPSQQRQMLSLIGPLATYPHKAVFPSKFEVKRGEKSTIESLIDLADEIKWKFKKGETTPQTMPKGGMFDDILFP